MSGIELETESADAAAFSGAAEEKAAQVKAASFGAVGVKAECSGAADTKGASSGAADAKGASTAASCVTSAATKSPFCKFGSSANAAKGSKVSEDPENIFGSGSADDISS